MFIAFLIVAGGLLIAALITFEFANAPLIEEPIE